MDKQLWSPKKAAIVAFVSVVVLGMIAGIVVMNVTGVIGDDPYARGQAMGPPLAILAAIAGFIAYKVQSKRNPDAF